MKQVLLCLTLCLFGTSLLTAQWTVESLSEAREAVGIAALGDKLFFVGGTTQDNRGSGTIDIYNNATGEWTADELPFLSISSCIGQSSSNSMLFYSDGSSLLRFAVYDGATESFSRVDWSDDRFGVNPLLVGDRIYVAGGRGAGVGNQLNRIDVYDIPNGTWTSPDTLSIGRNEVHAVTVGDSIFFMGGYTNVNLNRLSSRVDVFDLRTQKVVNSFELTVPRYRIGTVVASNKIYVPGGQISNSFQYTDVVDIVDVNTLAVTTTQMTSADFRMRGEFVNGKVVLMGSNDTDIEIIDIATNTSTSVSPPNGTGDAYDAQSYQIDGKVFFAGGDLSNAQFVYIYDTATGETSSYDLGEPQRGATIGGISNKAFVSTGRNRITTTDLDEIHIFNGIPPSSLFGSTWEQGPPVSVMPNPVVSTLTVDLERWSAGPAELHLYNLQGQLITQLNKPTGADQLSLELPNLPAGTYLLRVSQGVKESTIRVVKR